MFRWPVELTPLSLGGRGRPREATLEVTPRGAVFTLAALSHVGHPAHLALIDAYLKGQVRLTATTGIGEDSRLVAASLSAPLLAAHELGVERLTLADLVLLPRAEAPSAPADLAADGRPVFTPDSPRLLLRAGGRWHWVQAAERFEAPGCLGTRSVGITNTWHRVIAELRDDGVIAAEVREPSSADAAVAPGLVSQRRGQALASFAGRLAHQRAGPLRSPADLSTSVPRLVSVQRPYLTSVPWHGLTVEVVLTPERDGYQTLCLLPPADADPAGLFETMRDLAWETIEALIGRPLAERRTEPIVLRLIGQDGRSTTLDVGASVVIVRNQTVFTAWVGSDGRVMLKLFPPGGMTGG